VQTGNVTRLPTRKNEERTIIGFYKGYMESLYYGKGWKRLADCLTSYERRLTPAMFKFVCQMARSKKRPTNKQIATMVGLMISQRTEDVFEMWDKDASANTAAIVPINR
jgi:hypothetical protein